MYNNYNNTRPGANWRYPGYRPQQESYEHGFCNNVRPRQFAPYQNQLQSPPPRFIDRGTRWPCPRYSSRPFHRGGRVPGPRHQGNGEHGQSFSGRGQAPGPHQQGYNGHDHGQKRQLNSSTGAVKQKKKKEQPSPDSLQYYCQTCDRGYKTQPTYDEHISGHVKCGLEGCPYVASAKLVDMHRSLQHTNGLAKKIWQLESKDDLSSWLAERRKHYPTKQNIDKKLTDLQEKISRGEVLETKQFGKFGSGVRGRGNNKNKRRGNSRHWQNNDVIEEQQRKEKDGSTSKASAFTAETDDVHTERPRDDLDPLDYGLKTSDNTEERSVSTEKTGEGLDAGIPGALGSLMAHYADDSEEEGEIKSETEELRPDTPADTVTIQKRLPGEQTIEHKMPVRRQDKNNNRSQKASKHLSLLEKLLAKEIRHERNVILQCVRYIVTQNFFVQE